MHEFDRLPSELRNWTAGAKLPWRAKSVKRAFDKAVKRTGCPNLALIELDQLQNRLLAKDAVKIWGNDYPLITENDPS